jgi:hypothetical protein
MSYKVLTDGKGSGLIHVVGLGHFMRLSEHNEVIKELQFARQELTDLRAERDALAAQVEHLCYQITNIALCYDNNTGHEPSLSVFHRALDEAQEFIEKTPQQCLAEIRAEAIVDAIKRCNIYMAFPVKHGKLADEVIAVSEIKQYAEEIRQGGA